MKPQKPPKPKPSPPGDSLPPPPTAPSSPSSPSAALRKVADRPHWVTIGLGVLALFSSIVALWIATKSLQTNQQAVKVAQRAYLTYQVTVTNEDVVREAIRADKDFFLTFQVTVTNMGNTPADSIIPKLKVSLDPDRSPIMITFPNDVAFELGPKESRVLTGQALFARFHNVRGIPGLSTGLTGEIQYKDVFEESRIKTVCYEIIISDLSIKSGLCGTVFQQLGIK